MFTSDNSEFDADARTELNKALTILMSGIDDDNSDNRAQAEQSYSDMLNNAWHDGITADELVAAVQK